MPTTGRAQDKFCPPSNADMTMTCHACMAPCRSTGSRRDARAHEPPRSKARRDPSGISPRATRPSCRSSSWADRLIATFAERAEIWLDASSLVAGIKMLLGADPKKDYKDKVAEVDLRR